MRKHKKKREKKQTVLDVFLSNQQSMNASTLNKDIANSLQTPSPSLDKLISTYDLKRSGGRIVDLTELMSIFINSIKLPEISSPQMPRFKFSEITNINSRILVVTEKPKVATALAKALSGKDYKILRFGRITVYSLRYRGRHITIVPLRGHLIEYDTRREYKSWHTTDPLRIIQDEKSLFRKHRYPSIVKILRSLAQKHDVLFIATDSDEEGENIGWEAYQIIKTVKNMPVFRIWFLSLQPSELIDAFNNPTKPIINWALAPEARKIIDAFSGFSSTRELTIIGRKSGHIAKLRPQGGILSLGRVQSPTLYLLFLRERYIRNYKPRRYWSLTAEVLHDNININTEHIKSPFQQEEIAKQIYKKVVNAKYCSVIKIDSKTERQRPEGPLNTNKALIMLNKLLKLPSSKAMKILEDLYLEGLITYPRTDTDRYPDNYNHRANIERLCRHKELGKFAMKIISMGCRLRKNGRRLIGDHLPITPIDVPKQNTRLSDTHIKVYNLIVRRYLSLFMNDAILVKAKVYLGVDGETFVVNITKIKEQGFLQVYPFNKPKTCDIELQPGHKLIIKNIKLQKRFTKPPSRLSEAELLAYMERLGLGTKATRSEHIQKLVSRKYIIRKKGRLHLSELGYRLCEFLEKIWPEFLQPYFNAYVHTLLRKIMNGEIDYKEAVSKAREKFIEIFLRLRKSRDELLRVLSSVPSTDTSNRKRPRAKRRK